MTGSPCRLLADGSAGSMNIPLRSDSLWNVPPYRSDYLFNTVFKMTTLVFTPFAEIGDFRDAEINGVPALFTASRVDPITLPDGTYCYDIMGGRSSSFLNVVSLAPVYFTGAIVTLQPLLRGWQTFVEIRNYGIYGKTGFDEWRERWQR